MKQTKHMYPWILLGCMILIITVGGCAFHGIKQETGRPIDESKVRQIVKGKTTADEILAWFGAPTTTSRLGGNELFVYKHCTNQGSTLALPYIGKTETKEICNELTVTFNKSGRVKAYNYRKRF